MNVKKLSDRQLKTEYKYLYDNIYNIGCYGSKDIILSDFIEKELAERGIFIQVHKSIRFIQD